ncbi:DUF928 domain-containing protein [Mastigocoleus testarum]|uniref:DUF928 domain-containing protein n=1 Tax=Mastigocoleus testarum BC008 TaxID=371196 RepID=A0A0V7ZC05_9CYAN|nr:DUF928 domain-containing protein [Mastigocoleus testarum]KST62048.1 hypothetical protein BC008_08445 [Mastigocoleus testarum BC008]KST62618.1 hypothetical protein BC008_37915 [Mastigocoleus testarum BC008]
MQQDTENFLLFKLKTTFFVTIVIMTLVSCSREVFAESHNLVLSNSQETKIRFIPAQKKPPPKRGGNPSAPEGTGSRGKCFESQDRPPLTIMVGSRNLQLTIDKRPTFWMYTPYDRKEPLSGEFSLQNGDNEVFRTSFKLPTKSGVFSISLPPIAPGLEIGSKYRWYIDINCPMTEVSIEAPTTVSLTGVVKRVNPSSEMTMDLSNAKTPVEKIKVYAKYGVWFNTLTEIAQQRIKKSQDANLKKIWIQLLSQPEVGLEEISQESIIEN